MVKRSCEGSRSVREGQFPDKSLTLLDLKLVEFLTEVINENKVQLKPRVRHINGV